MPRVTAGEIWRAFVKKHTQFRLQTRPFVKEKVWRVYPGEINRIDDLNSVDWCEGKARWMWRFFRKHTRTSLRSFLELSSASSARAASWGNTRQRSAPRHRWVSQALRVLWENSKDGYFGCKRIFLAADCQSKPISEECSVQSFSALTQSHGGYGTTSQR